LIFINAVANQLAVALDRARAWRLDVTRREHAELGRDKAEREGATADRERIDAEVTSSQYQALAAENARLYAQAQQAVHVREQILAIVSHDLRNPLSTILMTTGVLAKRGTLPQAVGRIQRAADRMRRLIEDLLDFASIEGGSLAIRRQPQETGPIVNETAASFEDAVRVKGLQLKAEVAPNLPRAYCDRDRILQVLSNLVGNATKATASGGHVTLRVEARESDLMFTVADDGPGISEDDVKHLFERYWRSGAAEYRGTGLGLAISRGIVSAHGGQLWVETELGRGAAFFFTIPATDETSLFAPPAPGEPLPPGLPPPEVLESRTRAPAPGCTTPIRTRAQRHPRPPHGSKPDVASAALTVDLGPGQSAGIDVMGDRAFFRSPRKLRCVHLGLPNGP